MANAIFKGGGKYNKLLLTGKSYFKTRDRSVEYVCDCGNTGWAFFSNIVKGNTKSCGCHHKDVITKHGMSFNSLYKTLSCMKNRCYNEGCKYFHNYGARGITICEGWMNSFELFYDWAMNNGWEKGLSLDRIDNNGNYEPSNCRWTNDKVQSRNKRTNVFYTAFGKTKCLRDWIDDPICPIKNYGSFYKRIKKGMSFEDAITKPISTYNKNYIYK